MEPASRKASVPPRMIHKHKALLSETLNCHELTTNYSNYIYEKFVVYSWTFMRNTRKLLCKHDFYVPIHRLGFKRSIFDGIENIAEYKEYRDSVWTTNHLNFWNK